jgi:lysyl-tRNA synthetase class 1
MGADPVNAVPPLDGDWVARFADDVMAEADRRGVTGPIVCASGISPSGPIHLGNLRELLTPHFVADELRRRGRDTVHVLSWDDYDRFRKVPAGIDPSFAEHIGRPYTAIPAPPGSSYQSWAEHFKAPLIEAMRLLGVQVRAVSQTQMYTSGAYREQILLAMKRRLDIDSVLAEYRTKVPTDADSPDEGQTTGGYYPYKPYCDSCNRDLTTVLAYDDDTTELTYDCSACGHRETVRLSEHNHGKLVWKVDWPMRWAYEGVLFEPSGVDHSSPGSSFQVGTRLVSSIFGVDPPIGPMYAFVGISGMAKMSSSKGGVPIALDALRIMEPQLLRWMYVRRRPNQSFNVSFDQEIQRLYDEWDSLSRKVSIGTAAPADAVAHGRAIATVAAGILPTTPRPLPYRALASIADITTGNEAQMLRIVRDLDTEDPITTLAEVRPRLDCAAAWVTSHVPAEERTHVRAAPDEAVLSTLSDDDRESLRLLVSGLDSHWSLDRLTTLVYGVPKQMLGLPMDVKPTAELKVAQRTFFALLYRLLVGRDTGPRLPTLLLAIGAERVRTLLGQ